MKKIKVVARDSPLSQEQVKEFENLVYSKLDFIEFENLFIKTYGDLNHSISLRNENYDDLFTKEIDEAVLNLKADLAIHSAKDLPQSIHPDLEIYTLTPCLNPFDSLVLKDGYTISTIPFKGRILASSLRRENMVKKLRKDLIVEDVRGTIQERLAKINQLGVFGCVVAEVALIRLQLTHLNRIILPNETHPMQGRLAIIGKKENVVLKKLIQTIYA